MMGPLATGELQVVIAGGINPGLFNAVARDLPIVLVAGGAYIIPGHDGDWYMVRSDLKGQIKDVRDLKGKVFALNAPGSPMLYALGRALEAKGFTLKDVEVRVMPFPDMAIAFTFRSLPSITTPTGPGRMRIWPGDSWWPT